MMMKPAIRKIFMLVAASLVAGSLGGCVYYPNDYYGYGYGGGYYAYPAYTAPPAVSGSVTIGGWWWGGHRRWGWGGHDHDWYR